VQLREADPAQRRAMVGTPRPVGPEGDVAPLHHAFPAHGADGEEQDRAPDGQLCRGQQGAAGRRAVRHALGAERDEEGERLRCVRRRRASVGGGGKDLSFSEVSTKAERSNNQDSRNSRHHHHRRHSRSARRTPRKWCCVCEWSASRAGWRARIVLYRGAGRNSEVSTSDLGEKQQIQD